MKANDIFSISRFAKLCLLEWNLNKRKILLASLAVLGTITVFMVFLIWSNRRINYFDYSNIYYVFLLISCVASYGFIFQGFRSKELTITYLTLPVSFWEKVSLEMIIKPVLLFAGYTLLFCLSTHLYVYFVRIITPELISEQCSFSKLFVHNLWHEGMSIAFLFMVYQIVNLGVIVFQKSPIIKIAAVSVSVFIVWFLLFFYLKQTLHFNEYVIDGSLLRAKMSEEVWIACIFWILGGVLLLVSYFKLKEKEV